MRKGFTLIELLVVVAISAMISAIALVYTSIGRNQVALTVETSKIEGIILQAKNLAISTYNLSPQSCGFGVSFNIASNTYSIFEYSPTNHPPEHSAAPPCPKDSFATISPIGADEMKEYSQGTWNVHVSPGVKLLAGPANDAVRVILFYPPAPSTYISRSGSNFLDPKSVNVTSNVYLSTTGGEATGEVTVNGAGQVNGGPGGGSPSPSPAPTPVPSPLPSPTPPAPAPTPPSPTPPSPTPPSPTPPSPTPPAPAPTPPSPAPTPTPTPTPTTPPPTPLATMSLFDQNWNNVNDFPSVPFTGLRLWDTGTSWQELETSANVDSINWTPLDRWLKLAKDNGNKDVLYVFGRTPHWISSNPTASCFYAGANTANAGCSAPPSDLATGDATFKAFVTALVNHSLNSSNEHIKYYEIWNEADLNGTWSGTPAQLAQMGHDAYTIIHSLDPSALVLSPSVSTAGGSGLAWFGDYLSAGGAAPEDIISYHAYYVAMGTNPQGYVNSMPSLLSKMRAIMATNGVGNKTIWFTEGSWGKDTTLDATDQASYLSQEYVLMWAGGVGRYYWYSWDNADWGELWTAGGGVNPAGNAYAQTESWLAGATNGANPCTQGGDKGWTCNLTLANGHAAQILWNSFTSKSVAVNNAFTVYQTNANNTQHAVAAHAVTVGNSPILVY